MKYRNSKSTLFLMELIIAICFFAITSAVCAQIFAKSHVLSIKTTNLNHAVAQAESAAEAFRALDGSLTDIHTLYPEAVLTSDCFIIYFDAHWQRCAKDSANFILSLIKSGNDAHFAAAQIEVSRLSDSEIIYTLEVQKFVKGSLS